jgi:hypothetical protein
VSIEFDVFHDGQFWVGVLSLTEPDGLRACRVTFGAEPSDAELHDYLLAHGYALLERVAASPPVESVERRPVARNPKRAARLAAVQAQRHGTSTAAQEAIRLAQEAGKRERRTEQRLDQHEQREERRQQERARARAKHRGR